MTIRKKKSTTKKEITAKAKDLAAKQEDNLDADLCLSNEDRLRLIVSMMERDLTVKEMAALHNKIETLDREKTIMNLKMSDLQAVKKKRERDHNELIADLGRKMGVNLKNSTICPESGKITFA